MDENVVIKISGLQIVENTGDNDWSNCERQALL